MASTWRAATNLFRSGLKELTAPSSNTLQSGTIISVGSLRVEVLKQLAEGGFAFVYMVRDVHTEQPYALKRLLVNDQEDLAKVKEEIEFMKRIPRHKNIVEYRSAGICQGQSGGSEVLIVMEFCPEPSLYEILDRRFKNYFSEGEVLDIFSEVCEGVAHLHSLQPPIAHRDLKVENVLKCGNTYKLCDFGSATTKTYQPTDSRSINLIEDEINRYTTAAYRSPEMIDLWQKQKIDEKVDIWALGCLLYRICFFLHPFDDGTNLQILNVNYEIPKSSPYSPQLHQFIQYMINPDPTTRPNIYQVMERLSQLRGVSNPVPFSPTRPESPARNDFFSPTTSAPVVQNATAPTDVFAMLDWQGGGNANKGPVATSAAPQSATPNFNADFADFSNAQFSSASQSDTSFFNTSTPNTTHSVSSPVLSTQAPSPVAPKAASSSNPNASAIDFFSSPTSQPVSAPVQRNQAPSPVAPKPVATNNPNASAIDFFGAPTATPVTPMQSSPAASPVRPAGNVNAVNASILRNSAPSNTLNLFSDFQAAPSTPAQTNNAFSGFHAAPNTANFNSPVHSSYSAPGSPMGMHSHNPMMFNQPQQNMGSLFNSVAATPAIDKAPATTKPSGDQFANLRNLM